MSDTTTPITLDITPDKGGRYKAISTLSWVDIPGFAILTGRNGSGKTQLLEVLAYYLSGARPPGMQSGSPLPVEVRISGQVYQPEEIAYVPSAGRFSGGAPSSLATLQRARQQALQHAQQHAANPHDIYSLIRARRILKRSGGRVPNPITPDILEKFFPTQTLPQTTSIQLPG
jgi:ABC-type Mn2+/Zn2+ transport system ATPase subunit